jgi:hypothetical protein
MYINRGLPGSLHTKFDKVFRQNLFHGQSSKSGTGSSIHLTQEIAQSIPQFTAQLEIQSMLDIPCGDLVWMSKVNLSQVKYIGGDIAPTLILHLKTKYPGKEFQVLNIVEDTLPKVDLIFCRDLFVHLSNKNIKSAIKNIKMSGSQYLATTTFADRTVNHDLPIFTRGVAWRTLNLELKPFNFPKPHNLINEKCTEGNGEFLDKAVGIYKIDDLP